MKNEIPEELKPYLGSYGIQAHDGACGEPIWWGYEVIRHCGDEIWSKLAQLGPLEVIQRSFPTSRWALITKRLTREEAEAQYGVITHEEFGPRGGWRSVAFGNKTFMSKTLAPKRT